VPGVAEAYSSGAWTVKDGASEAFVEAWNEFARWLSTSILGDVLCAAEQQQMSDCVSRLLTSIDQGEGT
jgi:hypothetical protein